MSEHGYYQEILDKIEQLIAAHEIEQAYWLLREELEMPYIPHDTEIALTNLFKRVNAQRNELNNKNANHHWTLEEIEAMLHDPFDEEIHVVAFEYLKDLNIRPILPTLKKYLMNSLYRNETKTHLLYLMKAQGIDEEVTIKKTNGVFTLNPKTLPYYRELPPIIAIMKILDDVVYIDNPSLYAICLIVLENYYYSMMPELLISNSQPNDLGAAIIYKAHELQSNPVDLPTICKLVGGNQALAQVYLNNMEQHQTI